MTDIREAVARAIAQNILEQADEYDIMLSDDLKIAWLDQGEVDFGLVADAARAAHIDAIMWPSEAMQRAGLKALVEGNLHTEIWQAMPTAMRNEK